LKLCFAVTARERGSVALRNRARLRSGLVALTLVGFTVAGVACSDESTSPRTTAPPPTVAPLAQEVESQTETVPTLFFPPGFQPADTRGVALPALTLQALDQPPIPVFGGHARMTGVVLGPDGPVEGATVRLERFVAGRGGYADVRTGAGGRFEAPDIFGGHYRVRAWKRKDLVTTEPQVGFVKDEPNSQQELSIGVERHDAKRLQVALDNGNPLLDQEVTLLALYDQEEVDENGIVRGAPFRDADMDLSVTDGLEVIGETRSRTGADGYARFAIKCTSTGAHDVTVTGGDNMTTTVTLPECHSPEESTTTTEDPTETSSTLPGESTTSTTSVPFPVGSYFTTPYRKEIPAGTYVSVTRGRTCSTEYELYAFDGWVNRRSDGTINVPYPARNLTPKQGTPSCTFVRTR